MPYSIGTPLIVDIHFALFRSAIEAAKKRSEATGDVVVIRDDLSGQVVALVLGGVVFVPERNSSERRTNQPGARDSPEVRGG